MPDGELALSQGLSRDELILVQLTTLAGEIKLANTNISVILEKQNSQAQQLHEHTEQDRRSFEALNSDLTHLQLDIGARQATDDHNRLEAEREQQQHQLDLAHAAQLSEKSNKVQIWGMSMQARTNVQTGLIASGVTLGLWLLEKLPSLFTTPPPHP